MASSGWDKAASAQLPDQLNQAVAQLNWPQKPKQKQGASCSPSLPPHLWRGPGDSRGLWDAGCPKDPCNARCNWTGITGSATKHRSPSVKALLFWSTFSVFPVLQTAWMAKSSLFIMLQMQHLSMASFLFVEAVRPHMQYTEMDWPKERGLKMEYDSNLVVISIICETEVLCLGLWSKV